MMRSLCFQKVVVLCFAKLAYSISSVDDMATQGSVSSTVRLGC